MVMLRPILLTAIPLSCMAFSSVPCHRNAMPSTTSLEATSSRRQLLQNTLGVAAAASTLFGNPTLCNAKGAYLPEAGFDDFSGGLTMPKYTVDSAEQLGLSGPGSKANPAKAAEMEKKQAQSEAKQQAAAAKAAAAQARAEALVGADADKIAKKEEAKKRRLANMSKEQREKIEAYEAEKAAKAGK